MARVYLDHASTTPPRPEAIAALTWWATLPPADPGRLHEEGRTVRDALGVGPRAGRRAAGRRAPTGGLHLGWDRGHQCGGVGRHPGRSGRARPVRRRRALRGPGRLGAGGAGRGAARGRLRPPRYRRTAPTPRSRRASPRPRSCTASGATTRWARCSRCTRWSALCREAGITVHVDAAAACGHVPTDLAALDADLVSVSAHKLGGVPGAGALIVRRGQPVRAAARGRRTGARAARPGWRPIPALLAFGAAAAALAAGGRQLIGSGGRDGPAPDRGGGRRRAGGRRRRGGRGRRRASGCPIWCASACMAWRPSRC